MLAVPRAGWPAMAAAAFEAVFVGPDAPYQAADPLQRRWDVDEDGELLPAAPPYVTLSGPWARRLETWCRMVDRTKREPGAGIRSLVEDIAGWRPGDGAPISRGRGADPPVDPGFPVSLAFFVARLGRRAKTQRPSRRRRSNRADWAAGQRW